LVEKFSLLCLKTDIWLTARFVPAWIGWRDLAGILRVADARKSKLYAEIDAETIARLALAATCKHWIMRNRRCLRQGIVGYRFLTKAGFYPELHFGVGATSTATAKTPAHCWVVLNGKPIINDNLEGMATMYIHKSPSESL